MKIKNIIFDLDGTLIDSLPDIHASISYTLKRYNLPPVDMEFLGESVGHGVMYLIDNVMEHALKKNDIENSDMISFKKNFILDYVSHYEEYASTHGTLYCGVEEGVINLFEEGYQMFILTNKPQTVTENVLNYIGISKYFKEIIGDGKYPYRKPSIELWNILNKSYCLKNDETIVLGDGTPDFEFAQNAKTHVCMALYGITRKEKLLALEAEKYVNNFSEFTDYLKDL